jgi:hypothetical protein
MVTLLVIAFAISMRVENTASKNFNDLLKARQLAQAAVDQAVATIRIATPPVSVLTNYVTAPGVIYTLPVLSGSWIRYSLFTSNVLNTGSVDMNENSLITGIHNSDYPAGSSQLWVGWSNVTANGTSEKMRFAYWVDDESAKVNLNVAGTRGNDLEGYTPVAIDLQNLHFLIPDQVNITNYVSTVRPLDTIQSVEITPLPDVLAQTYSNNQFYVTVNSTSPDITPWGTKRLNVNSVVSNAVNSAAAVATIAAAFTNSNLSTWYGSGLTFSNKYPNVQQIAANIVDYIRQNNIPTDSGSGFQDTTPPSYLGLKQTPYINELVISNTFQIVTNGTTLALSMTNTVIAELWYMYTNQIWSAATAKFPYVLIQNMPNITFANATLGVPLPNTATITVPNAVTMQTSSYMTFSQIFSPSSSLLSIGDTSLAITVTLNPGSITAIFTGQNGRMDYAQILLPQRNLKLTIPPGAGGTTSIIWAAQCNDPRVKPVSNNWLQNALGVPPTLGTTNSTLNMTVNTGGVAGDGDNSCHIVPGRTGMMYPGDLSYIHTGVPWRTFWLQPQPAAEISALMIPDWAVLDLFSATDTTNVIGRVNINSIITNSSPFATLLDRGKPLTALLTNNFPAASGYIQTTAVLNTYTYAYQPASRVNAPPAGFSPYSYTMVGEVANTQGLSNTTPGAAKRDRETPVRGIANIITTKSDTFTIWAIAQVGNGNRPAEAKVQAIVQRTVDNSSGTPQVRFRTLYYRYIYE